MNKVIEAFYKSMLSYANLRIEDDIIVSVVNDKIYNFTLDGKNFVLPYERNLKDPGDNHIFHLLNENYYNAENEVFKLYKRKLVNTLNSKLSICMQSLALLAYDRNLQNQVSASSTLELVNNLPVDIDLKLIEGGILSIFSAATKLDKEEFFLGVYLKKNGSVGDTTYSAIGKINFKIYREATRALEENNDGKYSMFSKTMRKKDVIAVRDILLAMFPEIDDEVAYSDGADSKVCRYLMALLKTTYIVANRINEIADMLEGIDKDALNSEAMRFDLSWIEPLSQLQSMVSEIRAIPSQIDQVSEARTMAKSKLELDESVSSRAPTRSNQVSQVQRPQVQNSIPVVQQIPNVQQNYIPNQTQDQNQVQQYQPSQVQQAQHPQASQYPQAQQAPKLKIEDMVNMTARAIDPYNYSIPGTMMQAQYQQAPMMMPQQQMYPPQMQQMQPYQQPPMMVPQQQMYPQAPMMMQQYPQAPMMQPQQYYQQAPMMMPQQQMYPPQMQQMQQYPQGPQSALVSPQMQQHIQMMNARMRRPTMTPSMQPQGGYMQGPSVYNPNDPQSQVTTIPLSEVQS